LKIFDFFEIETVKKYFTLYKKMEEKSKEVEKKEEKKEVEKKEVEKEKDKKKEKVKKKEKDKKDKEEKKKLKKEKKKEIKNQNQKSEENNGKEKNVENKKRKREENEEEDLETEIFYEMKTLYLNIKNCFNKKNENKIESKEKNEIENQKNEKKKMVYTKEQKEFIQKNMGNKIEIISFTSAFNKKFGTNLTTNQIRDCIGNLIKSSKKIIKSETEIKKKMDDDEYDGYDDKSNLNIEID
jgi:hypothetical protein